MDAARPADLPASDEQALTAAGRQIWTAEVTGGGRNRWPAYFHGTKPATGYTRFRIQAAIARRDGGRARQAVVYLVWAGAGPGGRFREDRTATVTFIREETGSWTPLR